ncbi:MAG: aminoglycoside phosphotransferase family protein [Chloroflexota bacterium]
MLTQPSFPLEVQAVLGEIYAVTMPKQGATSHVWMVECEAGMRVVKHASRVPYVMWLMNEGAVLGRLSSANFLQHYTARFPFPKLFLDGCVADVERPFPYLVMSRLPGEPLATVMSRESDRKRRLRWMSLLGAMLRDIHRFPTSLWRRKSWLDEQLKTAASYVDAGFELDADDPARLLEHIRTQRPADVPQTFIHGDFMWDNVLVQDDRITGIVDWGGGAYGDPRYDLALAILPQEDGELSSAEVEAFYAGYGCDPLTETEYRYFTNLYEFF